MKKDITYITLPSDLIQWISQKVQTEYQDIKEAEEFVQGLKGLLHSQENALFLEKSEESESTVPVSYAKPSESPTSEALN